jgi:CubicO group peptidase (beta-lactamase class C family)
VLQLVAGGRVGLDDPVGSYLPRRLLAEMLTPVDTGAPGAARANPGTASEIRFR